MLYGHFVYFASIWSILQPFDIFYGYLVYFSPIWYFVPRKIWQHCSWTSWIVFTDALTLFTLTPRRSNPPSQQEESRDSPRLYLGVKNKLQKSTSKLKKWLISSLHCTKCKLKRKVLQCLKFCQNGNLVKMKILGILLHTYVHTSCCQIYIPAMNGIISNHCEIFSIVYMNVYISRFQGSATALGSSVLLRGS
jgi:hypothetical protein